MDNREVTIYALVDVSLEVVGYVGWCYTDRRRIRLREHVGRACRGEEKSRKAMWIKSLNHGDHALLMNVLQTCDSANRQTLEREWIKAMRAAGEPLLNDSDGGDGCPGFKHTPQECERIRARFLGKPKTAEHRKNLSKATAGRRRWSLEDRAKKSAALTGRKMPPSAIAKTAAAHRGSKRSEQAKKKMSAAWTPERRRIASERMRDGGGRTGGLAAHTPRVLAEYVRRLHEWAF